MEQHIKEVKNRIMLGEQTLIKVRCLLFVVVYTLVYCLHVCLLFVCFVCCLQREEDLSELIMKVIKQGLEGLVLKDTRVSWFTTKLQFPALQPCV